MVQPQRVMGNAASLMVRCKPAICLFQSAKIFPTKKPKLGAKRRKKNKHYLCGVRFAHFSLVLSVEWQEPL
jgi:hypothetical protein